MKRQIIVLASAGALGVGLLAAVSPAVEANSTCPAWADTAEYYHCNPPPNLQKLDGSTSTDSNYQRGDPSPTARAGQPDLHVDLTPKSSPVTSEDYDPDAPTKLADDCVEYAKRDFFSAPLVDEIQFVAGFRGVLWRNTKFAAYMDFRECKRRISSTEWHFWYDPEYLTVMYEMNDTTMAGTEPRYWCHNGSSFSIGGFVKVNADAFLRDGSGHAFNPDVFSIDCVTGWFGNVEVLSWPRTQQWKWTSTFGYPKWEVHVKVVEENFADQTYDGPNPLQGRMIPS